MNKFLVASYIRLSKEDEKNKESESVSNQRQLINQYLKHHNLELEREYIDDGYTGTCFDRPAFNRLIKDIELGTINMVITKDLSRLGRDYIKCGYFIEEYFPLKKIRYVSILDNIDTFCRAAGNEIAPFKALFNDMVSKDTSRKIKSILETKKKEGFYLSSFAPYGYKKSPSNKYKLIIDLKTYKIVQKIFDYFLNGKTINAIAGYLNANNIPSPSKYKGLNDSKWGYISVYNILKNKVYTGVTIQNVWTNISYKNKTKIKRHKEEWIIKENAHKAIISKNDFYNVQKNLQRKSYKPLKKRPKLLLEGFIYCKECGHLMGVNYNKKRNNFYLICNGYKKNTSFCTSHYMNYKKLEGFVLNSMNKYGLKKIKNKPNILHYDSLNGMINLNQYNNLKNEKSINRSLIFKLIDKIVVDRNKNIFIKYKSN